MIEQLKFELQNPSQITAAELLQTMSIGSSEFGTIHGGGGVSDKTMSIVAHYGELTGRMNFETLSAIKRELRVLMGETSKLELYVDLLDAPQAEVIRLRDFEGKPWSDIEMELKITVRQLNARRRAGIEELAIMYGFVEEITHKRQGEE